jgi:hypothetical protein
MTRQIRVPAWARGWLEPLGYLLLAAVAAWWTWRALHDASAFDVGLVYRGGQAAWATGHPEDLPTFVNTPFLAASMAIVTRLISVGTAADLITLVNLLLVVALIGIALHRLRPTLSPVWWWVTALALVSYAPMMSTVWWKQFNIIVLALAVAGFDQLRRGRKQSGAALIGLSVAVKPMVILLPLVLLARRGTRGAGALAITWVVALTVAGQAFIAARAHDLGPLNPLEPLHNFADKTKLSALGPCLPVNFAPGSLLCRLAGTDYSILQHALVWGLVALLGVWVIDALRGCSATSWEVFAFTCALSTMVSPLAWSHYQVMLAPLFLLLVVRFSTEGATIGTWFGLATAFFLASLMLTPHATVFGGQSLGGGAAHSRFLLVASVAGFAQYVLVLTGVLWFNARQSPLERIGRTRSRIAGMG